MRELEILEGGCLCGRIRYRIQGIPDHVGHCHCGNCRKVTGAAFATFAWVEDKNMTWTGTAPKSYRSSELGRRGFCAHCGTTLYFQYDEDSEKGWDLDVGSLDDPGAVTPKFHTWYPNHVKWLTLTDDLPKYDKNSPQSDVQI